MDDAEELALVDAAIKVLLAEGLQEVGNGPDRARLIEYQQLCRRRDEIRRRVGRAARGTLRQYDALR